ncbi:hypothetical protein SAMN05216480_10327 [Pustulibacterium marinum]|uniref:Fibronectin type-III domain-containing protein n=1 Tax=Pustulibacterium marinum TaxID=1224947 RepID=A0A1I7G0T7_9FLAO|nr:hypothetical protein [Pustulibacterium marinum]SFU41941.1 hypothetical protein SAMN05216480_10327 [Pustulibacterium marinum]
MRVYKVHTNYSKLVDAELGPFSTHVHECLTGNTNFTLAEGDLTTLSTNITNYTELFDKLNANGMRTNTIAKNDARQVLIENLRVLATTVNLQAYNQNEKLQSSGFTLNKQPETIQEYPAPIGIKVWQGNNSGTIHAQVPPNSACELYVFYYTDDATITDPTQMKQIISKKSKVEITGLTTGTTYTITAAYRGSSPKVNYANFVTIIAP